MLTPNEVRIKRRKATRKWQQNQRKKGLCVNHSGEKLAPGNANHCQICVDRSLARSPDSQRASTWEKLRGDERVSFTRKDLATLQDGLAKWGLAITENGIREFSHITQARMDDYENLECYVSPETPKPPKPCSD